MKKQFNRILGIVCICCLSLGLFNSCQDDSELLALEQGGASSTDVFLKVDKLNQPTTKTKGSNVWFTKDEKDIVYKAFTRIVENASDKKGKYDPSRLSAKSLNMDEDLFDFSFNFMKPYIEGKKIIGEKGTNNIHPRMKTRTEGGGEFGGGSEFGGYASAEEWLIATYAKDRIYEMICEAAFDSDFERKCFKQYFYAYGDMELSSDEWNGIKSAVDELNNFKFVRATVINGQTRNVGTVSFYSNSTYDRALGTSTLYKDALTNENVGFYDIYDFNMNADRTFEADAITFVMGPLCKMLGAKPYKMCYGDCDR